MEEQDVYFFPGAVSSLPIVLPSSKKRSADNNNVKPADTTPISSTSSTSNNINGTINSNGNHSIDTTSSSKSSFKKSFEYSTSTATSINSSKSINSLSATRPLAKQEESKFIDLLNDKQHHKEILEIKTDEADRNSTNNNNKTTTTTTTTTSTPTTTTLLDSKLPSQSTTTTTTSTSTINVQSNKEEVIFNGIYANEVNSPKFSVEQQNQLTEFLQQRVVSSFKETRPRKHQADTVVSILKDLVSPQHTKSFKNENRYNYLIQHAAGSGKSLTIACLTYFLYKLEVNGKFKFDTIIIMNDRSQLDAQLGDIVIKFLKNNGITSFCRPKTSGFLKSEIQNAKTRVIITTMQKFSQLLPSDKDKSANGDEFGFKTNSVAIISDEAHRSHGKATTDKLHQFLSGETRQSAKITYFSFTCTPTIQCLEMFGISTNGDKVPFYTYSMNDALNDKLILNVLSKYQEYDVNQNYNNNNNSSISSSSNNYSNKSSGPSFKDFYDIYEEEADNASDESTILYKTKFIVEHLVNLIKSYDYGLFKCRAMLVCNGRKNLIAYKKQFDQTIKEYSTADQFDAIAAFSPLMVGGKNIVESDPTINGIYSPYGTDKNGGIVKALIDDKSTKIRLLIVADKLQTGFDEPSLSIMYVDKPLKGANAVQTLSRLSRTTNDKTSTCVVDFINSKSYIDSIFDVYKNSTGLLDLQETQNLLSNLFRIGGAISSAWESEKRKNVDTFCGSIVYQESKSKNSKTRSQIYEYILLYTKLLERGGLPSSGFPFSIETAQDIIKKFEKLNNINNNVNSKNNNKTNKNNNQSDKLLFNVDGVVKVKLDYLTDEETKLKMEDSCQNNDYDADFAISMWASKSDDSDFESESDQEEKEAIYTKMENKLKQLQKPQTAPHSTNFFEIASNKNLNNNSNTNNNNNNNEIINNNNNSDNNDNINFKKQSIWSMARANNQLNKRVLQASPNGSFQPSLNKKPKPI